MTTEHDPSAAPIFAFHEAPFFPSDLVRPGVVAAILAVPLLGLPIKWALNPTDWPPEMPPVVLWLILAGLSGRFILAPMVATWLRVRRGEKAGLRVAEGDEYVEVAFFVGSQACRVQRFAYAEIAGCGTDRFQVTAAGGYELRPYVAERGMVRGSVKTPIPLAVGQDFRKVSPGASYAIAADLDRVIRCHCDLPQLEISLAAIADEKQREMMRAAALVVEKLRQEKARRASRFLGQDWPRIGLALAATAALKLLWLDDLLRLRWDDGFDLLLSAGVLYGFYGLAGRFLTAWRERPSEK